MTFSDLRRVGGRTKENEFIRGEKEGGKKILQGRREKRNFIGGESKEKIFNGGKRFYKRRKGGENSSSEEKRGEQMFYQ